MTAMVALRTFSEPMMPEIESNEPISTGPTSASASRTRDSSPRRTTFPAASRSSSSRMPRRMKNVLPPEPCTMASGWPTRLSASTTREEVTSVS